VGGVERARHLLDDRRRTFERQRAGRRDLLLEVRPVDPPHRDIEEVAGLPRVVDLDDVRVLERGEVLGLAHQALAGDDVQRAPEHLQRDGPLEDRVGRPQDDAHAAGGRDRLDPEAVDLLRQRAGLQR